MRAPRYPSPAEWLYLVVGLALTWRYAWLLDDAFVYFRYVDNWVLLGRGLVYNDGEFVEGFTSPLWCLTLAALRLLPLDYWTLVLGFALACFVAFFWLVHLTGLALSRPGPVVNLPLALLVAHYGVTSYFSSGMETPLVQVCAALYACLATRPNNRAIAVLCGLAPLVRPELVLPWAVYSVGLYFGTRRWPIWLMATGVLSLGAWLVFRVYYYAELLPNTFYLKDETDFAEGARYLQNTLGSHAWLLAGVVVALLHSRVSRWWRRSERRGDVSGTTESSQARAPTFSRRLMLAAALPVVLYVWRVGGDMLYYRFLAFPFVLAVNALGGLAEAFLDRFGLLEQRWAYPLVGASVSLASLSGTPAQLVQHPLALAPNDASTMTKVYGISDASWHRHHPDLRYSELRSAQDAELRRRYREASEQQLRQRRVVVDGWCVRLFYAFDSYAIHWWGLTEPVLARSTVPSDRPGHRYGLVPLAKELARVRRGSSPARGLGVFRRAVRARRAPDWIRDNLGSIEVLEHKMYNHHHFLENLRLALTPVAPIQVPARPR